MLILTRNAGEEIMIGTTIRVTIVSVRDGQVKLGITAPREVSVHRREVFEQIQTQNQLAKGSGKRAVKQAAAFLRSAESPRKGSARPDRNIK